MLRAPVDQTRTRNTLRVLALAVGAVGAVVALGCLAGCGGAAGGESGGAPTTAGPKGTAAPPTSVWANYPNPCGLLTDQEIGAVAKFVPGSGRRDSRGPNNEFLPNCMSQNRNGIKSGYFTVTLIPPGSPMLTERSDFSDIQDIPNVGRSAMIGHIKRTPGKAYNVALVDMGNGGFLLGAQLLTDTTADEMRGLVQAAASRW